MGPGSISVIGVDVEIGPGPITGLGVAPPKTNDVDLEGAAGSYAARDLPASRVITIPLTILAFNVSDAMNALGVLNTAWAPSTTDIPLYIRLPYTGKFHVNGRPRGLVEDLVDLKSSTLHVLATFFCPDPTITTP
jgi:hypothetical protein